MFTLQSGQHLDTDSATYEVLRPLGTGGRGQTYLAKVIKRKARPLKSVPRLGVRVVIKTVKIELKRGVPSTQNFIDFVNRRLAEEDRALFRLRGLKSVAQSVDIGEFPVTLKAGVIEHPRFLVQQYINGITLIERFAGADGSDEEGLSSFNGFPTADEWFDLGIKLADALLAVHQRSVVHNDIWHWNIMLNKRGSPVLIDFGEAVFRTARELIYLQHPNRNDPWIAPEWKRTHLRPSRRADIFSLGGVLHWMACGIKPPMPERDIDKAKLDIETVIRKRNPRLLAENVLIADIVVRCRRYDRERRISDAEQLRRELVTCGRRTTAGTLIKTEQRVARQTRSVSEDGSVFRGRMADIFLRRTAWRLEDLNNGVIEFSGNHEDLVSGCVDALASLKAGDQYLTVSTLAFWKPENIGIRGRFWSMNHLCAQHGVRIRRVFLLTKRDLRNKYFWSIMRAQVELGNLRPGCENIETRFRFMPIRNLIERIRLGDHCGFWISGDETMDLVPVYDERAKLRSIRLLISTVSPEVVKKKFASDFDLAEPLTLDALEGHLNP